MPLDCLQQIEDARKVHCELWSRSGELVGKRVDIETVERKIQE